MAQPQPRRRTPGQGQSAGPVTRDSLLSPADKQALIADARAKDKAAKAARAARAAASPAGQAELQALKAENVALKAKLTAAKGIAVSMSARSGRMSQVPGYVLKEYSDKLLQEINRK